METSSPKEIAIQILALANIKIGGQDPWDIHVNNEQFYTRTLKNPALGLGETYMAGWWDCASLDEFFYRIFHADLENVVSTDTRFLNNIVHAKFRTFLTQLFNYQTKDRSLEVGKRHYDIGNDLYHLMLDKRMNYSCGYWQNCDTLDAAQEAKLDLICRKLNLQPGMNVLDIGCGWGGFSKYAAEKYGVSVVGVTISQQQLLLAQELCAGLPVEIRFQDYRDVTEKFDRLVSIGMFEHVGHKNYGEYMHVAHRCLKDGGLFLLHTIGNNFSTTTANDWTAKYIFPNGNLPSVKQIGAAIEKLFVMEDWHNFGSDYEKTLMTWYKNFNNHWDSLKTSYDEQFRRMWNFYLLSCAGAFRARNMQLWQIVLAKPGVPGVYQAVR